MTELHTSSTVYPDIDFEPMQWRLSGVVQDDESHHPHRDSRHVRPTAKVVQYYRAEFEYHLV